MTKKELVERTRKALETLAALPPDEQLRRMIARGIINEKGEVLFGGLPDEAEKEHASKNGTTQTAHE